MSGSHLSDLTVKMRQALRAGPRKLVLRATHRAKVWALSGRNIAQAAGFREGGATWLTGASPIAEEVLRWRSAAYSPDTKAVETGEIRLRDRVYSFGPLDRFDWSKLGQGDQALVNLEFELAFLGYVVPAAARAPSEYFEYLSRVVCAIERGGRAAHWSRTLAWKPISVASRLINLIAIIHLGKRTGSLSANDEKVLSRHAGLCARFLERFREDYLGYNHLAANLVALFCWHSATGAPVCAAFERYLVKSLEEQILADGGHAERSPCYHLHVLSFVKLAALVCRPGSWLLGRLQEFTGRMLSALDTIVHPDGDIALFNDSSLGDAPPARLYLTSGKSERRKYVLPDSGFAKLEMAGCAILMDAGPQGEWKNPGHGHAGYLSCEVSWNKLRFIVDPGVASYVAGDKRGWTRSARSHNGPQIRQKEPMQFSGAFGVGRYSIGSFVNGSELDDANAVAAEFRAYFSSERARREIVQDVDTGGMLIIDSWSHPESACDSIFCIDPSWTASKAANPEEMVFSQKGERVAFRVLSGKLGLCAHQAAVYPYGPASPQAAHCLNISPAQIGEKAVRVIAIGDKAAMDRLQKIASKIVP